MQKRGLKVDKNPIWGFSSSLYAHKGHDISMGSIHTVRVKTLKMHLKQESGQGPRQIITE